MSERFCIPRRLDDPPTFFFWQFDTVLIVVGFFIIGSLLQLAVILSLAGIFVARGWSRLRASGARGILPALLYWYSPCWLPQRPPSCVREYVG